MCCRVNRCESLCMEELKWKIHVERWMTGGGRAEKVDESTLGGVFDTEGTGCGTVMKYSVKSGDRKRQLTVWKEDKQRMQQQIKKISVIARKRWKRRCVGRG